MDTLDDFGLALAEDSLEDLRERKHALILSAILDGTSTDIDLDKFNIDFNELLSPTWSTVESDDPDNESMFFTDLIQYGALNRLFSIWTKNLTKMSSRFKDALDDIKKDIDKDGYDEVNDRIESNKSLWLTDYRAIQGLQRELENMHTAAYKLYSNPISAKLSVLQSPLLNLMKYTNIGDTKWIEAIKTFVFTTVGSAAFKLLGAAVGQSVGGIGGAGVGLVAGAAVGNVVGATAAAKFSSTSSNKKKGFDLKKLIEVTEDQIKLIEKMNNISDYKKQLKINKAKLSGKELEEFKDKIRTIKSAVKLMMSLTHVVNRGIIEAY